MQWLISLFDPEPSRIRVPNKWSEICGQRGLCVFSFNFIEVDHFVQLLLFSYSKNSTKHTRP